MRKTISAFAALAVVGMIASARPAIAQERTPPPSQNQPQAEAIAQGELVQVDAKANLLTIKGVDGAQMQFRYTPQTRVTGANEGVAGLATMSGARVTVQFTQQGADKIATEIAGTEEVVGENVTWFECSPPIGDGRSNSTVDRENSLSSI